MSRTVNQEPLGTNSSTGLKLEILQYTAVGDAYGASFEFADNRFVHEFNRADGFVQRGGGLRRTGVYTDDTQMAIAIALSIIDHTDSWTPEILAGLFVECFKRDQRRGYARGFHDFLCRIDSGAEFLRHIKPYSDRCGSAMRAVPVGIFPMVETVKERATLQARLTHDTAGGISAATAASLIGYYFIHGVGVKADLGAWLESLVPGDWSSPWEGMVYNNGIMVVRAVVTAIERSNTMTDLLRACVAFTGDVDSVAAVALGAASACDEIDHDLPEAFWAGLENGPYGLDYLRALDARLTACCQNLRSSSSL